MEVRIVRSRRRTLGLEVRGETVLVRAPYGLPNTEIQRFLTEHQDWVAKGPGPVRRTGRPGGSH